MSVSHLVRGWFGKLWTLARSTRTKATDKRCSFFSETKSHSFNGEQLQGRKEREPRRGNGVQEKKEIVHLMAEDFKPGGRGGGGKE